MDQICRLCLTVSENMVCKFSEVTKILDKLSCLNIQILLNKSLPSFVCFICSKTLDDVLNYRENIVQNQFKLIEQLKNGINLDDFYQSLKEDIIKSKTEIYFEDSLDQSVYYESEPLNDTKRYKTDEDEVSAKLDKGNDESVHCKPVDPMRYNKKNKNTQEEKKNIELKKAHIIHGNDISNTVWKKKKERKLGRQTKTKKKQCKSKHPKKNIGTKCEIECKKEENISEENSIPKYTNHNETESNNVETSTFNVNEIYTITKDNKCLTCFKYLPSSSELIRHYRTIHNNISKENAKTDLLQNNSRNDSKGIEKEIGMLDKSERPYNCKVCGRTFTSVYAIIRHARAHSNYSLSCSHGCGYSTVYRGALSDHEKRHEKDFRYKCQTCGAGFHVQTWHVQHQNIHKNVRPFVCDLCGMAFHMDRYLTSHRAAVHAKLLKGVKRFICPHCDVAFATTRNYRTHLEEHRGKKTFLCTICGKECSSGEQLKYHNNSHLGVKPFACSICNKRFAKKFNLSVHQRAHAGEKHLCQQCGKHFAQRSTLLRHTRKCHPESKKCKNESDPIDNRL